MSSPVNFGCAKSPSSSVICEEVFDEGYQPSEEEIKDYAVKIGIDPNKEPYLLHIAKDGLMQAIPPDWQVRFNEQYQAYYYFNRVTKVSQWEHPLDNIFKDIVKKARKEKQLNEDKSEENSNESNNIDSGIKSLQEICDEMNSEGRSKIIMEGNHLPNRLLTPINGGMNLTKPNLLNRPLVYPRNPSQPPPSSLQTNQIGLQIKTENNQPINPFNKNPTFSFENNKEDKPSKIGFALTGTGSMFLKSNTQKTLFSTPTERKENNFVDIQNHFSTVKGILRDSSVGDVKTKLNQDSLHHQNFNQSIEQEDRKSVRFSIDDDHLDKMYSEFKLPSPDEKTTSSDEDDGNDQINNQDDSDNEDDEEDDDWDVMEIKPQANYITEIRLGSKNLTNTTQPKVIKTMTSFGKTDTNDKNENIKPLYDDESNSDSANSIRLVENYEKISQIKEKLKLEEEIEEKNLREEMNMRLQELKSKLMEKNKIELNEYELDLIKKTNSNELEKLIKEENEKYENLKTETLENLKSQNDESLKNFKQQNEDDFLKEKLKIEEEHRLKINELRSSLENELENLKLDLENKNEKKLDDLRVQLASEFDTRRKEIVESHRASVEVLQKNHNEILEELERDLKTEEELLKKDHLLHLSHMKDKLAHELEIEKQKMRDTGEDRLYEKVRCEKRLLEDKYRCLKEKYIRLKTDVKLSLERRNNRRKEQTVTTGSETEKSISNNANNRNTPISAPIDYGRPPLTPKLQPKFNTKIQSTNIHCNNTSTPTNTPIILRESKLDRNTGVSNNENLPKELAPNKLTNATVKYLKQIQNYDDTTSMSQSDTTISNHYQKLNVVHNLGDNGNSDSEAIKAQRNFYNNNNNFKENPGRQRKKIFTRMKSASTSRLNSSNKRDQIERPCTPVENLRRQLQKLEDLEDQFPDNSLDTTYHLRYPFTDIISNNQKGSSELEFFKHRIHLERDSVRRAKESLRTQRTNFRAKQREIKQRHKNTTRHTLDQLIQEEKELTEMEVNLHRTRALLGEKVIRLRHLEQSLQRIYEKEKPDFIGGGNGDENIRSNNKDDATLSDLSSHSSSGFSSTDFATDTNQTNLNRKKENIYQESSEIIQSLENLNAEIKEIWEILSKQQSHGLTPPPTIFYPDINWGLSSLTANHGNTSILQNQHQTVIPTLADRLETYRQIATGRTTSNTPGLMSLPAANTIVSQAPLAQHYTTSLVERTRDLRNWLRQAKNEHELLSGSQQADL